MDKSLILAVAGSGKTTLIVDKLNLEERFLLVTYTINNTRNLKEAIVTKFGYLPENINLFSYYNFLYSFCFRPFLGYKLKPKGIFWDFTPVFTNRLPLSNISRYMTKGKLLYHNRIAKLLEQERDITFTKIDFNTLKSTIQADLTEAEAYYSANCICQSETEIIFVGDFYQHTFLN